MTSLPPAIEMRVERIADLFDPLDPFPIPTQDLAPSAEAFILGWAREVPRASALKLIVHVPAAELERAASGTFKEAIAKHFAGRAHAVQGDLDELFRVGRRSLAIGLTVLAVCVAISSFSGRFLGETPVSRFLTEGVIILGWVANWRPLEIFLYDWWPLVRRKRLFERLAAAPVETRAY